MSTPSVERNDSSNWEQSITSYMSIKPPAFACNSQHDTSLTVQTHDCFKHLGKNIHKIALG